jgi:DNA polymerase I-like protein with 3'-5' exonuclease and polymerase domains
MLYGCGARKLQEVFLSKVGLSVDFQTCKEYVSRYWITNDRITMLKESLQDEIYTHGGIRNPYGRFINIHVYDDYKAVNYLIQSTAGDVIKDKMPGCRQILKGTDSHLILQVHDELGFEMRREDLHLVPKLKKAMEELTKFKVPLTCSVSYGLNWKDKKELSVHTLQRIMKQ